MSAAPGGRARTSARGRILAAAAEVAREQGAGNLSLDAVAARAGVSKGGLLYHFPSKAELMRTCVEAFVLDFEARLETATQESRGGLLGAFVRLTLKEFDKSGPGASAVLAAMADDPDFLQPVKAFKRRLLDRLLAETDRPAETLLAYLALEGLRSLHLFEMDILSEEEVELACEAIEGGLPAASRKMPEAVL